MMSWQPLSSCEVQWVVWLCACALYIKNAYFSLTSWATFTTWTKRPLIFSILRQAFALCPLQFFSHVLYSPLLYCVCRVQRTFVQGVFPQIMRFTATGLNFFLFLSRQYYPISTGCSEIGRFKGPS